MNQSTRSISSIISKDIISPIKYLFNVTRMNDFVTWHNCHKCHKFETKVWSSFESTELFLPCLFLCWINCVFDEDFNLKRYTLDNGPYRWIQWRSKMGSRKFQIQFKNRCFRFRNRHSIRRWLHCRAVTIELLSNGSGDSPAVILVTTESWNHVRW